MTDFAEKPTGYTVNTSHAKCPTHLYMLDAGSGNTAADSVGGRDLTNTGLSWGTDDLTAGGETSTVLLTTSTTTTLPVSSTSSFGVTDNVMLIAIVKSNDATNPAVRETLMAIARAAVNDEFVDGRINSSGNFVIAYDDTTIAQISDTVSGDNWDAAWHLYAVKAYNYTGGVVRIQAKVDKGGWSSYTESAATSGVWSVLDRFRIGASAGSSITSPTTASYAAVMLYFDTADPVNDWNDAFVDSLVDNPWQFLITGTTITPSRGMVGV